MLKNLNSLKFLDLNNNQLTTIPESIGNLKSLHTLNLHENQLTTLPESIGNLISLRSINISKNKLTTLPKSIGNLKSLQLLNLRNNELTILPERVGNLSSLQELYLSGNNLTTLPESIGNLKTLENLFLHDNKLTTLPGSMWQLEKLKTLELDGNSWKGEWKEIVKRDVHTILEHCRQKATINIFISHTVNEFTFYRIKELAIYLEQQQEINQVYFCEENLKGNIDAWMEETVPKSQLILFIGTQQSIFNSRDCSNELFLARKYDIEVTPIKGVDVSWEDLAKVGLSRELGFEFDKNNFDKLCQDLYRYICEFKREKDLIGKELSKIEKSKLEIIDLTINYMNSTEISRLFKESFTQIETLKQKFKLEKITFEEFLIELINLLKKRKS